MKGVCFAAALGLFLLVAVPGRAWENEGTRLGGINSYTVFPAGIENEDGKIGVTGVNAGGIIPFGIAEGQNLAVGASWQGLFVDYSELAFSWIGPDGKTYTEKDLPHSLHSVSLLLGYDLELGSGFTLGLAFTPALQSDFEDLSSKDIYYLGGVVGSWKISDSFTLAAGLYYADSFGEPELLPGVGVGWDLGKGWRLDAFIPQFANLEWEISELITLGLQGRVVGHEYRMTSTQPWDDTVLKYSQILAGPYLNLKLAEHLFLGLETGLAFSRIFEIREKDGSGKLDDGDLKDQAYLGGALYLSY